MKHAIKSSILGFSLLLANGSAAGFAQSASSDIAGFDREWLLPHMKGGKPKAFTKDQYRLLAIAELGPCSKAAFGDAWISAIEDTGRQYWYDPKSGRTETRQ